MKKIALINVDVYVNPTKKLDNATILIQAERILEVGINVNIPSDFVVINKEGFTAVASFIELYTDAGVLKATSQHKGSYPQLETSKQGAFYWNESIHPEINALDGFNVSDERCTELNKQGFGFAVPHQEDGIVRGSAPLIALGISNPLEATRTRASAFFYSFNKGVSQQTYPSSLMGSIALLRQSFYDLEYYKKNPVSALGKLSMDAWAANENLPSVFKVGDKWDILRAERVANEFKHKFIYVTAGDEYAIIDALKSLNPKLIVPLTFPKPLDVSDPYVAKNVSIQELKHWESAPFNLKLLAEAGISTAITTHGLTLTDFWKTLRKLIANGTSPSSILASLTTTPASYLGLDSIIGTLEANKLASFNLFSTDPFVYEANLVESWALGNGQVLQPTNQANVLGTYSLNLKGQRFEMKVSGDNQKPKASLVEFKDLWDSKLKVFKKDSVLTSVAFTYSNQDVTLQFALPNAETKMYLLHGKISTNGAVWEGDITYPDGSWGQWSAVRRVKDTAVSTPIKIESNPAPETWYPNMAYGSKEVLTQQSAVYEQVTIWTNESEGIIDKGYVVVQQGKITYVGAKKPPYPGGAKIINGTNMHLTSGIIDEHSHIAISRGVNEGGQVVSAEVSIGDVVYPEDISIYRQLAGGVTAAQLLHGSANAIGGQSALIKLKWGTTPEEMKIDDAPGFIKCALGENVKQSNWGDRNVVRFPQTRMGVEQVFYDAFYRAKQYRKERLSGSQRIDLELETLNEILDGKRFISCHSYVQSEVNMLMKVADSMGFKVNTFTHILEGYKVADKMKKHGVGGSTFADWWAYKFEVNDAIPYNAALMLEQGITVAINSDDAEMGRRLNQEAAKTVKYGGVSEIEAWKMVTLNPAKLLHLDHRTGSVKVGKDADLVLWTANPLSIEAKVQSTMIEGVFYFDQDQDLLLQAQNQAEKMRIIGKMLAKEVQTEPKAPFIKRKKKHFHCDTMGEEGSETENLH
jgi:imidazolonepropionase-like amidohydrolase